MFKKRKAGFLAGAAILLILLPVFFGCDNDAGDTPTLITYTVAEEGGTSYTTDSTAIKFTFSAAVDGLADSDITLGTGATAGTLTGSEKSYSLTITVVNAGQVTVSISKEGIEAGTKTVVVHKQGKVTPGEQPPEGINGFPETLTMGVPFNLRENITINLPDAPGKTFDDIIWASNNSGVEFASTRVIIEDDLFIPVTFFTRKVTVYAIVTDGEGEGFDYTETFETNIVFPLNPFIGSWSGSDGKTWTFKTDGTYGIDTVANAGSFAVWSGKPGRKFLVTVSGDPDTITVEEVGDPENGLYQPYCFEQTGDTITITPIEFDYDAVNKQDARAFDETGTPITLTRQSGEPAAFDLSKNYSSLLMIGGWSGNFAANPFNPASDTITIGNSPGITYYADGRVQQNYEGAWLKRGAVFVTVGNDGRRWDPPALASWDTVTAAAMDGKQVVRIHEYRPDGAGKPYSRATNTSLCWRLVKFPSSAQPSDPAPLVNPFTGVWKTDDNEYWQFNSDGTGGKADAEDGTFPDEFSFLVFAGADVQATPSEGSLVMLDDSDDDSVSVTRYTFSIVTENATTTATLTATGTPATTITLEQVSGEPAVLDLTNQFVGEWYAAWPNNAIWSIKYRADGTVRTFHHQANHQFDNAYAVRGDTLVIFGQMRFASAPIAAEITQVGNTWRATEKSTAATKWTYTKVDAAQWKEE